MQSYGREAERQCTKLQMEELPWEKVWTVNAADVEWVECEHVNKTSFLTELYSKIKELKGQLDLTPNDHKIEREKSNPSSMT